MATQTKVTKHMSSVKSESSSLASRVKIDPSSKDKKKITGSSIRPIMSDTKPKSAVSTPTAKSQAKAKVSVNSVKNTATTSATKGKVKREKKVFSLPGQKFDLPEEREPLRIFYESLSKQIPGSEMAEFWLMEHGMLSPEKAKRAHEKKQRKMKQIRMGTPSKPTPSSKPESSQRTSVSKNNGSDARKKKKVVVDDDDDDDDFILSHKRRKM